MSNRNCSTDDQKQGVDGCHVHLGEAAMVEKCLIILSLGASDISVTPRPRRHLSRTGGGFCSQTVGKKLRRQERLIGGVSLPTIHFYVVSSAWGQAKRTP